MLAAERGAVSYPTMFRIADDYDRLALLAATELFLNAGFFQLNQFGGAPLNSVPGVVL